MTERKKRQKGEKKIIKVRDKVYFKKEKKKGALKKYTKI